MKNPPKKESPELEGEEEDQKEEGSPVGLVSLLINITAMFQMFPKKIHLRFIFINENNANIKKKLI